MMIPVEDRDTYEDKLRRRGYSEEAIMMLSFTRRLTIEADKDKNNGKHS